MKFSINLLSLVYMKSMHRYDDWKLRLSGIFAKESRLRTLLGKLNLAIKILPKYYSALKENLLKMSIKVKTVILLKLRKLSKNIKKLASIFLQYVYIKRNRISRIWGSVVVVNARNILRILLLLFTAGFAYIVCSSIDIRTIDYPSLSNWFIAIGGMIGGVFAIVFTLLEYAQTNSAYLQSNKIYRDYIHDRGQKLSYVFFTLTILYFVFFAYIFSASNVILPDDLIEIVVSIAIYLVGSVLITIDCLHEQSFLKSTPITQIRFVEKIGINLLKTIKKDLERVSTIIRLREEGISVSESQNFAYALKQNRLLGFSDYIEYITGIVSILAEQRKINDVRTGISVINNLINTYLEYRKDNSAMHLSDIGILNIEGDDHKIIASILESINRLGRYFVTEDFEVNAIDIIDLYENIAINAFQIKYLNRLPVSEHPILNQIVFSFNEYVNESARNNKLEVVYQALNALERIGLNILNRKIQVADQFVIDKIELIHYWGLQTHNSIVIDRCREIWVNLLLQSILSNQRHNIENIVDMIFESLKDTQSTPVLANKYFQSNIQLFTILLTTGLPKIMNPLLNGELSDPSGVFDFIDKLWSTLQSYAENTNTTHQNIFGVIGKFITFIERFMVKWIDVQKDQKLRDEIKDKLGWYIHLPAWFMNNAKLELRHYDDLIDSSTILGLMSIIELEDLELTNTAVSSLKSILDKFVAKENNSLGFDEPRVALSLSYLGIIALKKSYTQLFDDIKKYLLDFDDKYQNKHKDYLDKVSGLNTHQVVNEVWSWRDNFNYEKLNTRYFMDDIEELLQDNIVREDIDRFIFEVWGACDDKCSLREEHEEIINQSLVVTTDTEIIDSSNSVNPIESENN